MHTYLSREEKWEYCALLSSNLFALRQKTGLKQHELSDKLGLTRQIVSFVETGKKVIKWRDFAVLMLFFANSEEIKEIMVSMKILDSRIGQFLNVSVPS